MSLIPKALLAYDQLMFFSVESLEYYKGRKPTKVNIWGHQSQTPIRN